MKPLKNFILVKQVEQEKTSAGGIVLTGSAAPSGSKPALVLAVGPDVSLVESGDTIAIKWGDSLPVQYDGEAALISEESVYGVY
jgi:co-chaperonin GroES (HSP10)